MAKNNVTQLKADANDQRKPDTLEQQERAAEQLAGDTPAPGDALPAAGDAASANDAGASAQDGGTPANEGEAHPTAKPKRQGAVRGLPPAAENLARNLILAVVDEIKAMQKPWQQLDEVAQDDALARIRKRCNLVVADAVAIAAAGGDYKKAVLELAVVNSKAKTTEVKLTIPSVCSEEIHNLLDVRGQRVVVLLGVDPATFGVGHDGVKADANQLEISLEKRRRKR